MNVYILSPRKSTLHSGFAPSFVEYLCKVGGVLRQGLHNRPFSLLFVESLPKVAGYFAQKAHLYSAKPLCKVQNRSERI